MASPPASATSMRPLPAIAAIISSILLLLCELTPPALGCTTIAVGKDASSDGSVMCSHSNDGEGDTDPRLVLIPASDWSPGSSRPVFYSPESFPRYVGTARALSPVKAYEPGVGDNAQAPFEPICTIAQVPHTYRYFEETYGAHNEKQLGIAESTCSGVFGAAPKGQLITQSHGTATGKACFSVDALTQIAMERHHRARDAIQEMGELAESMGFYGAGLFEGTAESLIVTDPDEAWVFHILPDPTGASAIWAAQRVPDDSFAVVPNVFIIREIDPNDPDNFMYSQSTYTVAQDLGWWNSADGKPLDFTAQYSDGEYAHLYYSGRRSWGIFHLFAPSLELPADYVEWRMSKPYPFAAKPDGKIGLEDVAAAMRYFYEGTDYSQAGDTSGRNLAGGPWKTPDHVAGNNSTEMPSPDEPGNVGNWERTIGLYRSSDTYISQSRGWLPDSIGGVLWYGAYAAPYSVYVPFAAGMETLPDATLGHHMRLDKQTLFWANRYLGNYVQLKWNAMMEEVVAFRGNMMKENLALQARVDTLAANGEGDNVLDLYAANAVRTVQQTWDLCDHLMFKYADGQIHSTQSPAGTSTRPRAYGAAGATTIEANVVSKPGYPGDWLEAVGFPDGPPSPPDCADFEWKCGHKPLHLGDGGSAAHLRGELNEALDGRGVANLAWMEYLRQKEAAINGDKSFCAMKGDVAAAVRKCTEHPHPVADEKEPTALISTN